MPFVLRRFLALTVLLSMPAASVATLLMPCVEAGMTSARMQGATDAAPVEIISGGSTVAEHSGHGAFGQTHAMPEIATAFHASDAAPSAPTDERSSASCQFLTLCGSSTVMPIVPGIPIGDNELPLRITSLVVEPSAVSSSPASPPPRA